MSRNAPVYTIAEADRERCFVASRAAMDGYVEQLMREKHPLWNKIDCAAGDLVVDTLLAAHTRLCRLRPDLADLFALAIWRAETTFPEWLDAHGRPKPRAMFPPEPGAAAPADDEAETEEAQS